MLMLRGFIGIDRLKSLLEDTKAVHFSILLSALWMKKFLLLVWIEFWLTVQPLGYQQPSSEGNFLHTAVTNLNCLKRKLHYLFHTYHKRRLKH